MDVPKLKQIRGDAYRFILGTLWLSATAVLTLDGSTVAGQLQSLDSLLGTLKNLSVPTFVIGFLTVAVGVVLPYCLVDVFSPIARLAMNLTLLLYKRIRSPDRRLISSATEELSCCIGNGIEAPHYCLSIYLQLIKPSTSRLIEARFEELRFNVGSLVPGSIILAWIVWRGMSATSPATAWATSLACGVAVFWLGAFYCNRQLFRLTLDTAVAVLTSEKVMNRRRSVAKS